MSKRQLFSCACLLFGQCAIWFQVITLDFYFIRETARNGVGCLVLGFHHSFEIKVVTPFVHGIMAAVVVTIHIGSNIGEFFNEANDFLIIPEVVARVEGERGKVIEDDDPLVALLGLMKFFG